MKCWSMEQFYDLDGNPVQNVRFQDTRSYVAGSTVEWKGEKYKLLKAESLYNGVNRLEVVPVKEDW